MLPSQSAPWPSRRTLCLITLATLLAGGAYFGVAPGQGQRADRSGALRHAIDGGRARSVILFIGDGMGDSEITAARNYHAGAAGRLRLDTLPFTGAYTTYAVQETNPALPDYVVDSAASATAFDTGHKTSNGRISTAPLTDAPLRSILELAQARGLRTGNVTTAELTDATPAVLAAHVNHRSCEGPADMGACPQQKKSAGGHGSIAEQLIDHGVDVLLGGGRARFEHIIDGGPEAGQTVLQSATRQGYDIINDAAQLKALAPDSRPPPRRVLGLFADGNMSTEWSGEPATLFPGSGPQRCLEGQRPETEPSLAAMTRQAIALLDNPHGFFVQIEGALIDKRDHAADPCGQIGDTIALDAALGVALDYATTHSDTLIVITGDHAQTSQIVPPPNPRDHPPGLLSTLLTVDGVPMTISYATGAQPGHMTHTGTQIRIAAQGPQAANVVGVTDQTDLFYTMARALGVIEGASETGFFARMRRWLGLQ